MKALMNMLIKNSVIFILGILSTIHQVLAVNSKPSNHVSPRLYIKISVSKMYQLCTSYHFPMQYEQPLCDDSRDTPIVCGKLQVNGRSVTALKVCDCGPSRPACPMNFDPYDGQTGLLGVGDQLKASLSIKSSTKHLE